MRRGYTSGSPTSSSCTVRSGVASQRRAASVVTEGRSLNALEIAVLESET